MAKFFLPKYSPRMEVSNGILPPKPAPYSTANSKAPVTFGTNAANNIPNACIDTKIAMILGLTHLINIAFANILAKDDKISLTEKMSGTTFKAQKILAESIMTESPELIETIISNPEIRKVAEEFWKDVGRLLASAQEGKSEEIIEYINMNKEKISQNVDLEKSYKKLTKMVNTIEK